MIDASNAAREDLAFLRAVAEGGGPPPSILGMHILAVGLIFGLNLIGIWAGLAFDFGLPRGWFYWSWTPGAAVYAPVCLWLSFQSFGAPLNPTARIFLAAWAAVGVIAVPIIVVMEIARAQTGVIYEAIWPPLSLLLWGGAWAALGIIRRKVWHGAVAFGCLATATAGAALVDNPASWLVMGVGLLLFMAAPGAAIVRMARRQA